MQGRWLRATAKKTVGSFGGRTQFIPTACPLYTVGTDVLGCPNRMSAGASHRPTEEVICVTQTNLSDLEYNACNCLKAQSDSRGRLSLQWENERLFSLIPKKSVVPPPYGKRSLVYDKIKLSDLKYNSCFCIKPYSDSRGRLSLQLPSPSPYGATSPEGRGFKKCGRMKESLPT